MLHVAGRDGIGDGLELVEHVAGMGVEVVEGVAAFHGGDGVEGGIEHHGGVPPAVALGVREFLGGRGRRWRGRRRRAERGREWRRWVARVGGWWCGMHGTYSDVQLIRFMEFTTGALLAQGMLGLSACAIALITSVWQSALP
jgi:hypothetical protein